MASRSIVTVKLVTYVADCSTPSRRRCATFDALFKITPVTGTFVVAPLRRLVSTVLLAESSVMTGVIFLASDRERDLLDQRVLEVVELAQVGEILLGVVDPAVVPCTIVSASQRRIVLPLPLPLSAPQPAGTS